MKNLIVFVFLSLAAFSARADQVTSFSGGDGTTFVVSVPSIIIATGQKSADDTSWSFSIYDSSGVSYGTVSNFIGAGIQSDRPITTVVALTQPGTYSISGTPQDGDQFSGTVIPTTDLADQSSVDAINSALTTLQDQTTQNTSDISSLETLDTTLQNQVNSLQATISTLQSNVTDLQTDLSTTEGNVATLQTNLGTAQSDIATLQTSLGSTQSDVTTLQTNGTDQQNQLNALNSQLATLNSALTATNNALQTKITALQQTVNNPPQTGWTTSDYLILGGVAAGATGLGIGAYSLFDSSSPSTSEDFDENH